MVAGLLRILGVYMGDRLINTRHPGTVGAHEDRDFAEAKDYSKLIPLIEKRNAEHDVWGFKDPFVLAKLCGPFIKALRNPQWICIYRDPVAIELSRVKRGGTEFDAKAMRVWANRLASMAVYSSYHDALHLSYPACLNDPIDATNKIAAFCDVGVSRRQLNRACAFVRPGYRELPNE